MLNLAENFSFTDLYDTQRLVRLDEAFLEFLRAKDSEIAHALNLARVEIPTGLAESKLILKIAPFLEDFIAYLFNIETEVNNKRELLSSLAPIFTVKRLFIQREVAKQSWEPISSERLKELEALLFAESDPLDELAFAQAIQKYQQESDEQKLQAAKQYSAWALNSEEGRKRHKLGVLFKKPEKLDFASLFPHLNDNGTITSVELHQRKGFKYDNPDLNLPKALDQSNYCIHCHNQGKDYCSKGQIGDPDKQFKENPLGISLNGCPLDEKISEMNLLKSESSIIGALATAMVDNPMIAATGHRICNDCMKACIYQKQNPVDIPLIESQTLLDVLELPWGFEIYSLLNKWNPLKFKEYLPAPNNYKKVLVVGQGPAGFTISHYLSQLGYTVVAIDGLKIEPLNPIYSGIDLNGNRCEFKPVYSLDEIFEDLDHRYPYGFGGVAEYGITVRWNKNYLKILRLLLERRSNYRLYGGVRFGSQLDYNQTQDLGFDHIVLATGAGKPTIPQMKNSLATGVRTASDFLMSLQLGGAHLDQSLYGLEVRMPIVVIGGGLTSVDAATESMAYYITQIKKYLAAFHKYGEQFLASFPFDKRQIVEEFIKHAKQLEEAPNKVIELIKSWGGVKIAYRKRLIDSPAYRLNHEEVQKALEQGIEFVENITPSEVLIDSEGRCVGLKHENGELACKTLLLAVGTQPNTILSQEDSINFSLDGRYFTAYDAMGIKVSPEKSAKPKNPATFCKFSTNEPSVTFLGDLHPSFAGNVVKAMASAKKSYPLIDVLLKTRTPANDTSASEFYKTLDDLLIARVESTELLTHNIVEIIIRAPLAARNFHPGQFYRLQNYNMQNTSMLDMEGIALTGAWVDKKEGLVSLIVLEMGGSSSLCRHLKKGENVVLMGPTGTPTDIPQGKHVMLVGGGLGNAVLFSIGKAMRDNGCKVLYFAGYRNPEDRFKHQEIELASDVVVWACDKSELSVSRSQDYSFQGNMLEAIKWYGDKENTQIALNDIDHMVVIGSDKMMAAVAYARHNQLREYFKNNHVAIASINSPMQCMMKEICGQCIQRHVNYKTGEEAYVFSCTNQDQIMDDVDFENLSMRLKQNSVAEGLCSFLIKQKLA